MTAGRLGGGAKRAGVGALIAVALACPGIAQITSRASVATGGIQGNGVSFGAAISGDGRLIAFWSDASNLVPGDTNGFEDVFVSDRVSQTTELVSVGPNGEPADQGCSWPLVSSDGRYVAFGSAADNLVPGDTNRTVDVFVRDRLTGTTTRASVDSSGVEGNDLSYLTSISADGRYVAFDSRATNLVPGDTNGHWDAFVHDLSSGATIRVSVDSNGVQGNDDSADVSISGDGRSAVFWSRSRNLVPADSNGAPDVFMHDLVTGATSLVSVNSSGRQANSGSGEPAISADGRYVAFGSYATNLGGAMSGQAQVYRHDLQSGETILVSVNAEGTPANGECRKPALSTDGRYVAFESQASNLVSGDTNACGDVFLRDCAAGVTTRVSVNTAGTQGDHRSGTNIYNSPSVSISSDGRYVAFGSEATNLVIDDTNATTDVFVHEVAASAFASVCEPGAAGVIGCPCENPPSASGRGCDNASTTGGAVLGATGIASLSHDDLVFTTSGENPTALSIVMQGNAVIPNGVVYGQGVRCVGGTIIRRLYVKHASHGSITAPELGEVDPSISARSAAKGDVIQAGESRWYLVYYRDPNQWHFCPATSTFNTTQTGRINWTP